MGLVFQGANAKDVFFEDYADKVNAFLLEHFGEKPKECDPYCSEELGWSGWRELQDFAKTEIADTKIPHFLSMEAWQGVFVPFLTEPGSVTLETGGTPLSIGCLQELLAELGLIAATFSLPTDEAALHKLHQQCSEDDDRIDSDMHLQTFCQLLLAAQNAKERSMPLWVVK